MDIQNINKPKDESFHKKNDSTFSVLMIGTERKIFEEGTWARERILEYSSLIDNLHIIILTTNLKLEFQKIGNAFLHPTRSLSRWFYVFDAVRIGKKIIDEKGQWVIVTQDPFEAGLAGFLIKKKPGVELQIQVHGDFLSPYFARESALNKIRLLLAKFLLPKADGIRVVSERIKSSIISKFQNIQISKIAVLPIFVDVKKIQEGLIKINLHEKYPQFDFIILMASRLAKVKNIDLAIEAMPEVIHKHPGTGLIIVGEGREEKNLRLKVKNLKLFDNIIFEPWNNDLSSYYKTADLFLSTSNHEGYGMTSVEAMAGGCPLVMTDVGCAQELVKNENNGLIIPVGGKEELVKAILKITEEPSLREKIKNNGLATVKNFLTKEEYLNSYKESWQL